MKKLSVLLLAAAGIGAAAGQASATPESRAAVPFLLIEPGARATAMGESYVATADDATASYFNPAALSGQTKRKFDFFYSKWLPGLADDLYYSFLAYAQPVEGWGNIGLNITLLDMGEQTRTDERGNVQGNFGSYDMAVSAAYGADIASNMSAGIGLKFIRSHLADQGAGIEKGKGVGNSFAADLGLLWRLTPSLNLGAALRNMGPKIAYIDASQADPLPQHLVVGAAYELLDTEYNDLLLSLDMYKPLIDEGSFIKNLFTSWTPEKASAEAEEKALAEGAPLKGETWGDKIEEMDLHFGGEYKYGLSAQQDQAFIALRGGYSMDRDGGLNLWTTGIGLKYNLFQVDVAYVFGNDTPMEDNTRFSLNLTF